MKHKKPIITLLALLALVLCAISFAACNSAYQGKHEIPGITANAVLNLKRNRLSFARGMEIDDVAVIAKCEGVLVDDEGHTVNITEQHLRDGAVKFEKFELSETGVNKSVKVSYKNAENFIFYDVVDYRVVFDLGEGKSWKSVAAEARLNDELALSVWIDPAFHNYSTDEAARKNDPVGAERFKGWYTSGGELVTGAYSLSSLSAGLERVLTVHAEYLTDTEFSALALSYDGRGRRVFSGYKGEPTDKVVVPEGVTFIDLAKIYSASPNVTATGFSVLHVPSTAEMDLPLQNILNTVGLTEITVDRGNPDYTAYEGALYSKDLNSLYLMPAECEAAELSDELVSIERFSCAFWQTATVILPANVNMLGSYCFAYSGLIMPAMGEERVATVQAGIYLGTVINAYEDKRDDQVIARYTAVGDNQYRLSVVLDKSITEYKLLDGTIGIAGDAFGKCTALKTVDLGNSLVTVGDSAFADCTALQSVALPATVKEIGSAAFRGCSSLTSVTGLGDITYTGLRETKEHTLPDMLFYDCAKLVSVNCAPGETGAKLDENILEIGADAFRGCALLTSVTFPKNLKTIENNAFYACGIAEAELPATLSSLGAFAFYYSGLQSVNLEDCPLIKSLPQGCFGYAKLTEVVVPDWITEIPSECYYYNARLVRLDLGNVTAIGYQAFSRCGELSEIIWSDELEMVGARAFRYCTALQNVTLPESVLEVGGYAFGNCSSLETVTLGKNVKSFGVYPFVAGSDDKTLGSVQPVFYLCGGLKGIYVHEENENFRSVNGVLYGSEVGGKRFGQYSVLYTVPSAFEGSVLEIESGVKWILSYSVENAVNITEIVLNGELENIGKAAFYNSKKLATLHIPASVTNIGASILLNCTGIETVTVAAENTVYASNGTLVYDKSNATTVMFVSNAPDLVIPGDVQIISDAVFMNATAVTSAVIPDSVTRIGYQAFKGCRNLRSLSIGSGLKEFDPTAFAQLPALESITVSASNPYFKAVDNALYSKDGEILYLCAAQNGMTKLSLEDGVREIAPWAFAYHATLSEVVFDKYATLKKIGEYAFYECRGVTRFFGCPSLEEIGERAFSFETSVDTSNANETRFCDALKEVLIYADTVAGNNAFYGQYGIENVFFKMTEAEHTAFIQAAGSNIGFLLQGCPKGTTGAYYNNDGKGINRYLYYESAPLQPVNGYGWFKFDGNGLPVIGGNKSDTKQGEGI